MLTPTKKMELTDCSETSAHKIQNSDHPKERIRHSEHEESFEIKKNFAKN